MGRPKSVPSAERGRALPQRGKAYPGGDPTKVVFAGGRFGRDWNQRRMVPNGESKVNRRA
jgi:hypothetical protein